MALNVCRIALALGKFPHQIMNEIPLFEAELLSAYLDLKEEVQSA